MNAEAEFFRVGPYLIVRTLGAGGMGRVQLALGAGGQEPGLCIIKRMHEDERSSDQDARFEREARIAARLSHPNIARTLRVEIIEGELCLIQEFVDGMNVSRLLRQAGPQPLPAWAAAYVVGEVAAALNYAHEFGDLEIVHRDVTPENIMLSYVGDVKLIDFGISRSRVDGTLTSLGAVVGRRAYMAPEVWAGQRPDKRADVYALGVVLWEMLTGRRLEEMDEGLWSASVPDPSTLRGDLPPALSAVVLRAVAPDPEARYQTAGELRAALSGFMELEKDQPREVATLLAFYFNVDRVRGILAEKVEAAKSVLRDASRTTAPRLHPARGIWIAAVVAGAVFASGVAISGLRRSSERGSRRSERPPEDHATGVAATAAITKEIPPKPLATVLEPGPTIATPVRAKPRSVAALSEPVAHPTKRRESADAVLRKAGEEFDDGHLADALSLAREAAASGGGARAHALLGYIYMSQGEFGGAERELSAAVRLNPGDAEAVGRLADARRARAEQGQ